MDANLVNAIVRARACFDKLRTRQVESIADLACLENAPRAWISQQLPLAFLAPDIVEMIATGSQPQTLTAERLLTLATQSPDWDVQRAALS